MIGRVRTALLWLVWSPQRFAAAALAAGLVVAFAVSLAVAGSLSAVVSGQAERTAAAAAPAAQASASAAAEEPSKVAREWLDTYLAGGPDKQAWVASLTPRSTARLTQFLLSIDSSVIPPATAATATVTRSDDLTAEARVTLSDGEQIDVGLLMGSRGLWLVDSLTPVDAEPAQPAA